MKGRARRTDSKFIFLCADAEYKEVERERKNFAVVIDKMKELAFGDHFINSIQPEKDILTRKKVDDSEYFDDGTLGALEVTFGVVQIHLLVEPKGDVVSQVADSSGELV